MGSRQRMLKARDYVTSATLVYLRTSFCLYSTLYGFRCSYGIISIIAGLFRRMIRTFIRSYLENMKEFAMENRLLIFVNYSPV